MKTSKSVVFGMMCGRCSSFIAALALIPSQALHGVHVCAVQNWDYKYESRMLWHSYRVLLPFSCLAHTCIQYCMKCRFVMTHRLHAPQMVHEAAHPVLEPRSEELRVDGHETLAQIGGSVRIFHPAPNIRSESRPYNTVDCLFMQQHSQPLLRERLV
jgi:hypothetical protein